VTVRVPVGDKLFAMVDDAVAERVLALTWSPAKRGDMTYAVNIKYLGGGRRAQKNESTYLHRFILGLQKGDRRRVDHKNFNGLDCRRSNMRFATQAQNMRNRPGAQRNNKLGVRGVRFQQGAYTAQIQVDGKQVYLGRHKTLEAAARAAAAGRKKHHGRFAS